MTERDSALEAVARAGERHVPALNPESVNHYRHLTAYHFALGYCYERSVLDYGCGTGYGTNLVFRRASPTRIVGMDVSPDALDYCQRSYGDLAGRFVAAPPGHVPAQSRSFDVVLLFQTIEHVDDDLGLLRELHRALRPGGRLLITTPNVTWSGGDPLKPANPHHVREYDAAHLARVCAAVFPLVGQMYVHGSFRAGGGGLGGERFIALRAVRKLLRTIGPRSRYRAPVSLADFTIATRGRRRALDLLFLCEKAD